MINRGKKSTESKLKVTLRVCVCVRAPVVAVEVVQPAAHLEEPHAAGVVRPGGEAVGPLVLLALAALQAALVHATHLLLVVVVQALQRLG